MFFDTFDRTGNVEFPFSKHVVFRAVCTAVDGLSRMEVESRDDLACRLYVKTGMSAFSWGEKVSISVMSVNPNSSVLSIQSGAKTIFGSATTHAKNRQNIREIINATSNILTQHGSDWEKEMNAPSYPSGSPSSRLIADEISKLADLLEKGVLTREEFDTQKAKLLSGSV